MRKKSSQIETAVKRAIVDKNNTNLQNKVNEMVKDQKWEDLEEIYQVAAKGLVEMGQYLSLCLSVERVIEYVKDKAHLDTLVKCVTSDITAFAKDLAAIRKQHLGKTGPIENETDLFICINIFQDYQSLETKLFSVITPVHMEAITILNEANEKRIIAAKKEELAKNNNKTEKNTDDESKDSVKENTDKTINEEKE